MTQSAITLVLVALGFLILLDVLTWRGVRHLAAATPHWVPRVRSSQAWARSRPIRAWVRLRYPRMCSLLATRLSTRAFTGLPLTLLVIAAAYIVALLVGLIEQVIEAGEVLRFDQSVNAFVGPWRADPSLVKGFVWITALGSGPALTAVAATATGFMWAADRRGIIVPLWVTFLGSQSTTWAGKYAIARHRPDFIEAISASSPAFPSGHATGAIAVFGFLAYVLARDLPPSRGRFEVVYWTGTLILMIGFSRIFLSVHYTTDVVSGFLVGGFWLLVGFALAEWARVPATKAPQ